MYSVSMYGGLVLFGLFLLYDTQRIIRAAEHGVAYDPVNM
jgi:FtsH-binding integral membrane protein